ncbi:MAG: hypothetical protein QNI91_18595 [Arenicellales bacterium]|nr:hypothetical protein [Arenicellales bacterium]
MNRLTNAYLVVLSALFGCSGGDTTSGFGAGLCASPKFNLTGTWKGTLTSHRDGTTRQVSAVLIQNEFGIDGSIVAAPCWPLDGVGGIRPGMQVALELVRVMLS